MALLDEFFGEPEDDEPYVVTSIIKSMFNSNCNLDPWHKIRTGDAIGRVAFAHNPFVPIRGFACAVCVKTYPKMLED